MEVEHQKKARKALKKAKQRDPHTFSPKTNIFMAVILGISAFLCVFPFIYVIIISLSSEESLIRYGYQIIPREWSIDAYSYLWNMRTQLFQSYGISVLVTTLGTVISVSMITLYSYAISRPQFRYRRFFTFFAFFTMLFTAGLVPLYIVMTQFLGLRNTIWALILPLAMNAFYIIIMRTFFVRSIPESILESARIDGANEWRIFFKLSAPLAIPGIATIALFSTLGYWNDWFNALLFIDKPDLVPLQALLMRIENNLEFIRQNTNLGSSVHEVYSTVPQDAAKMAMVVIATLPIAVTYPFFQRFFISGLTVGGVKE
ncbi:carbohydrate ABC transporter permease [Halalkalibacter sp. APA_J-10(15)]|uniref:carbohydrate ABC transporter permease n=1 Tax=Halalkalibacter sp. APA_J-10(15) TaxID=2933805 RepID=UPI001FF17D29|nr:carbohydrate ABC transporter permease [Halalkalibacter sp. APA_J-10(15)]MCK0470154.1 carbohydrate ABC transporter permease [Halalkalibacter sp. APA_J-10(15)]